MLNTVEYIAERYKRKGQDLVRKTGRTFEWGREYADYCMKLGPQDTPMNLAQYQEAVETAHPVISRDHEGFMCPTVEFIEDLVEQAMEANGFTVDARGQCILQQGYSATLEDLEKAVLHHLTYYVEESKVGGQLVRKVWTTGQVQTALYIHLRNMELKARDLLRESMAYQPAQEAFTIAALDYVLGSFDTAGDRTLAREMVRHWLWQTKRYILGLEVHSPIFLNFYGKTQHTGKTFFVTRLLEPVGDFKDTATLSSDERKLEIWTKNYALFFDEMPVQENDLQSRTNLMAYLKAILTSKEISTRVMRTTKHSTSIRTASPIAATNFPLVKVIYDPSGMRRFFEVVLLCGKDQQRIQDIISLDPARIWAGIDPHLPQGYVFPGCGPMWDSLETAQGAMKHREGLDDVLDFADSVEKPVKVEEVPEEALEVFKGWTGSATKLDKLNEKLKEWNFQAVAVFMLRKEYRDWLEENMGGDVARWLPQGDNFRHGLEYRGYCTSPLLVLCHRTAGGFGGMK